jgi:hypothetical protein
MNDCHAIPRLCTTILLFLCASAAAAEKPNILIIFTDDKY